MGRHTDYELARTFHPDSPASRTLPLSVRHSRFHAVTRAYDILRGRSNAHLGRGFTDDIYSAELARRRRQHAHRYAYYQRAAPESAEAGGADDAWKDQVIIVVGLAVRITPCPHPSCMNWISVHVVDCGGLCPRVTVVVRGPRCTTSRCVCQPCSGTSRSADVWERATGSDSRARR